MNIFGKCSRTMYEVNPDLFNKAGKIIYAIEDAYRNYCQDFHSSIAQMYTYLKILYRTYLLCWVETDPPSFCLCSEQTGQKPVPD